MLAYYFWWHYTLAIEDLVANYFNLAGWLANFFSLNNLTKNIFAPWRRLGEQYPDHFSFGDFFSALIVNTLMRIVGLIIRLIVIVIGLVAMIASLFLFVGALAAWLILPIVVVALFILGFCLIVA